MEGEDKAVVAGIDSVGAALPRQMARVRDEVLPAYLAISPSGVFAPTLMRRDLALAAKALAEGDVTAQIRALELLRGHT